MTDYRDVLANIRKDWESKFLGKKITAIDEVDHTLHITLDNNITYGIGFGFIHNYGHFYCREVKK